MRTPSRSNIRRNDVFADAFNFLIYDGEPVINPAKLVDIDTTEIAVPYGSNENADFVQKYWDVLKSAAVMADDQATYLVLGIENQSTISYAMPVRNMIYDALRYGNRFRRLLIPTGGTVITEDAAAVSISPASTPGTG